MGPPASNLLTPMSRLGTKPYGRCSITAVNELACSVTALKKH